MKKFLIIQGFLMALLGGTLVFFLWQPESLLSLRKSLKEVVPRPSPASPGEVVRTLSLEGASPTVTDVDRVRNFVHTNSIHREGTDYHKMALDIGKRFQVLSDIQARSQGADFTPELSCGPRSWAMAEVLEQLGAEWRVINIYFTERPPGELTSHTFLEVKDSQTGHWQIQDPDFNIVYLDGADKRLSSLELLTTPRGQIRILDYEGKQVQADWIDQVQGFRAIEYNFLGKDRQKNILLVDDDFFSMDAPVKVSGASTTLRARFRESLVVEY